MGGVLRAGMIRTGLVHRPIGFERILGAYAAKANICLLRLSRQVRVNMIRAPLAARRPGSSFRPLGTDSAKDERAG